ncbi:flagellar biosynthesis/type III secretory pathway chaperone [Caldicoprobacter guelmensis]|uniref:flagellar protein FlgN n=1 Tax=Caldicoprobacter guelmensis TaxID=1170224 RepID=UPI00195C86CF|nr:flagellar protein FlgN [Caldicoprobacter guelmensis]MBM7582623.1 flagellar biosynthesis/type III secretory pathway chaperone [Caldicoprobacter guelmensis]
MEDLQKIVDVLEKECELYGILLELSKKKTQVIANADIGELEKIVEMEERLIFELRSLEDKREDLVSGFAEEQGLSFEDVTVSYLVSQSEGQIKEKLKQLQDRLSGIIEEQKQVNQINERLIKNNLEFINFSIGLITGRGQAGSIYGKTGEASTKQQGRSLIDKKV